MLYTKENSSGTSSFSNIFYTLSRLTWTGQSQGELQDSKFNNASAGEIDQESNEEVHVTEVKLTSFAKRIREFGWWWEVLSAILAVLRTAHMTAILLAMDNRPLHDWKLSFIQPNSLVSVFSTIAKSPLLVPLAEGLGQLKWIYCTLKKSDTKIFITYTHSTPQAEVHGVRYDFYGTLEVARRLPL